MKEQDKIYSYFHYSDLKKLKRRRDGNPLYGGTPVERYTVPRTIAGVCPAKKSKELTKFDVHHGEMIAIEINIPRYYEGENIYTEEFLTFDGKYSEELLSYMLDDYIYEQLTVTEFRKRYRLHGWTQPQLLALLAEAAEQAGEMLQKTTVSPTTIWIIREKYRGAYFTFLIEDLRTDEKISHRIFRVLLDYGEYEESLKVALADAVAESDKVRFVIGGVARTVYECVKQALPSAKYVVDYRQVAGFLNDVIEDAPVCYREEMRECQRQIYTACTYIDKESQPLVLEAIARLQCFTGNLPERLNIKQSLQICLDQLMLYTNEERSLLFYAPGVQTDIYNQIKRCLNFILYNRQYTAERLYLHLLCEKEILKRKVEEYNNRTETAYYYIESADGIENWNDEINKEGFSLNVFEKILMELPDITD